MAAVPQVGEADHDVVATVIPPDRLSAQSRAANARDVESRDLGSSLTQQPRQPEIISDASMPRSPHFNTMAEKLKSAMKEVHNPSAAVAPSPASPERSQTSTGPANDAKEPANSTASKAAAAPTVKTEAPAPESDDEFDKLIPTKSKKEDWNNLKTYTKKWRNEALELRKKFTDTDKAFAEYKSKTVPKEQFEEISKQVQQHKETADKLTDRLKLVALEQSEEFGGFFQKQFDSALGRIKDSAGDHAELIESLAKSPASKWRKEKLQEIVSQLPDIDRASVALALADYDRVASDRSNQLKDWRENYDRLMAQRDQKNKQSDELKVLQENALLKELVGELGQDDNEFKLADGDEAHNAKVQHRLAIAEKFYRGQLERTQMQDILRTALKYDPAREKALIEELAQAKEAIANYQKANPSASGASARQTNRPTAATAAPAGERRPFLDKFMSVLGQEQG